MKERIRIYLHGIIRLSYVLFHWSGWGFRRQRTRPVAKSTGRFIIFANDDILPATDFVHQHAIAQAEGNAVILGNSPFVEYENPNLFDVLVENSRIIFFYCHLHAEEKYNFRYAWNLNLSVSRDFLEKLDGPFAKELRPVFYDDIEFAYRLLGEEKGVTYRPGARAVHDHRYTFEGYFEREALLGLMACQLWLVNRNCFKAIFSADYQELAQQARTGLDLDIADGQRSLSWLMETCGKPWSYDCDRQFLQAVYTAHLPLKRRAFRVGLKAAGDAAQVPWQERIPLARKAMMNDPVFSTCNYWSPAE